MSHEKMIALLNVSYTFDLHELQAHVICCALSHQRLGLYDFPDEMSEDQKHQISESKDLSKLFEHPKGSGTVSHTIAHDELIALQYALVKYEESHILEGLPVNHIKEIFNLLSIVKKKGLRSVGLSL